MLSTFFKKQNINSSKKGFTLVELIVALAIFAIISFLMSGIILAAVRVSIIDERKSQVTSELDKTASTLKNLMRVSKTDSVCVLDGKERDDSIYLKYSDNSNGTPAVKVRKLIYTQDGRLGLQEYTDSSECAVKVGPPTPPIIPLTTENLKINSLEVTRTKDDNSGNVIYFVKVEACDKNNQAFNCDKVGYRPYRYIFTLTSRS